jgi:hypothetical protein
MSDSRGGEVHANHPLRKMIDAADVANYLEAMA